MTGMMSKLTLFSVTLTLCVGLLTSPALRTRQEEYASKYHLDRVYTPQLVVDGRFGFVGSDQRVALPAIREAA
jgi:hypothetical protein